MKEIKLSEQLKPFELVNSVTMHYKNSQELVTEISKIEKRTDQQIMKGIFLSLKSLLSYAIIK